MGKKLLLLSLFCSAPATAVMLSFLFSFYSPIGTGTVGGMQSFLLGALFLTVIPTMTILYFYRKGIIDIELSERRLRTPFYAVGMMSQMMAAIVFYSIHDSIMFVTSMAYAIVTVLMMFINLKWKISAHASGVAGPVTAIYAVYGSQTLPLYLLLLPIFALRLKLKAHNIWQLIGGTLLATIVTYVVYSMML
ncbi:Uncharacterised protein [uncultured archaeon]|nr:Uncharacterised protein [uncultured archaeon]